VATGEPGQAREHTTAAVLLAEQLRETWWVTSASWSKGVVCLYQGDLSGAREMAELGHAAEPRDPRHLALSALLEYDIGDVEVASAHLARLEDLAATVPPPGPIADHVSVAGVSALAGCSTGDGRLLETATAAAERVLSLPALNPALRLYSTSALALVAVQRGDAGAARVLHHAIEPERGTACFFLPLTFDRLLGSLALTFGDVQAALRHFADGLAFCDRAGYRPEYARTARDYAAALRRAGDDDGATVLEAKALALAAELGMRSLTTSAGSSRPSR
jgi:hypothetical protein